MHGSYYTGSSCTEALARKHSRTGVTLTPDPQNGAKVKLWQCYDNHPPQEWVISRGQIKLAGTNLCLDIPGGDTTYTTGVQVWECSCNTNQAWRLRDTLFPGGQP